MQSIMEVGRLCAEADAAPDDRAEVRAARSPPIRGGDVQQAPADRDRHPSTCATYSTLAARTLYDRLCRLPAYRRRARAGNCGKDPSTGSKAAACYTFIASENGGLTGTLVSLQHENSAYCFTLIRSALYGDHHVIDSTCKFS